MYSSVPTAISELLANSHDADASEVFVDFHEKDGKLEEIIIHDNGVGMSPETVETAYLALGYNCRLEAVGNSERQLIRNKIKDMMANPGQCGR